MYLVDTNVVSERTKPQPDPTVLAWLRSHRVGESYLSVITLAELEQGILCLSDTRRAGELAAYLERLEGLFSGRILPIDRDTARSWSVITATAIRQGQTLGYADALIAATALSHNLKVVTRKRLRSRRCAPHQPLGDLRQLNKRRAKPTREAHMITLSTTHRTPKWIG